MLSLLHLASIPNRAIAVYEQQVQLQTTTNPWYQSLQAAHSKVETALSLEHTDTVSQVYRTCPQTKF